MDSIRTPNTPRSPMSPSFRDFKQPILPQDASTRADMMEIEPQDIATATSTPSQKAIKPPTFTDRCKHLMRPLAPLLSIETGRAHPHFPATLLHYHLLSHAELDDLAHFYHQRTPTRHSTQYPMPVIARWYARPDENDMDIDTEMQDIARNLGVSIDDISTGRSKRRRFGRFLGLQGMESAEASADGVMREEMERFVAREMARREEKAREREVWEAKGF